MSKEFDDLGHFIIEERKRYRVFPAQKDVFNAFRSTPFHDVKVVFLGLDPYIREGQATGYSFGVDIDTAITVPPSLRNIIREVESDLDVLCLEFDHSLKGWAQQGVLLLNTALTVREGQTGSHLLQWSGFTQSVLKALNDKGDNVIFILLGKDAQSYAKYLDPSVTKVIMAPHPAAESYAGGKAGFFGSRIFSKCNSMLYMLGKEEINWNIK
jgi:uracil-DNA glycosylase